MCIADLAGRLLLICLLFATRIALAHPVSQGALDMVIFPDRIEVRATVSSEEVLVAAAYGGQNTPYLEAARRHGEYLRAHLRIAADGRALAGRVLQVPEKTQGPLAYQLDYPLTAGAPARVELAQDVLNEFEFAPGNRWEASYLVRIGEAGQPPAEGWLLTSKAPLIYEPAGAAKPDRIRMAAAFVRHGITHILSGYDHLLFVAALVLSVASLWDLVKVISAFTLAHTITLALSVLDIVRLPGSIVEPMIAASIVVVAVQNIYWPGRRDGSRLLVAFLFGLFHGLGFAGGLLEAMGSLRMAGAAVAIAAFSVGVELGHQLVVLPTVGGLYWLRRAHNGRGSRPERLVQRYGSAAISLGGMIYLVAALR